MHRLGRIAAMAATGMLLAGGVRAELAKPWQLGMSPPASTSMADIVWMHDFLLIIITVITLFVLALLIIVMVRFNEKANPVPTKTTHNTLLEIAWTGIPVLILVVIAVPSLKLVYFLDRTEEPEVTLKVTGHQWYWNYEYPDENAGFSFDSVLIPEENLKADQIRLLSVDNPVVLPIETNIRVLTTAADVIHSWALPQLIYKVDSVPGRTNESWMRITREGTFYGQCSELCGVNHGYMPIVVQAVSKQAYQQWLTRAKTTFAAIDDKRPAAQAATDDVTPKTSPVALAAGN